MNQRWERPSGKHVLAIESRRSGFLFWKERRNGVVVEWWSGGVVEWWSGGVVYTAMVQRISKGGKDRMRHHTEVRKENGSKDKCDVLFNKKSEAESTSHDEKELSRRWRREQFSLPRGNQVVL